VLFDGVLRVDKRQGGHSLLERLAGTSAKIRTNQAYNNNAPTQQKQYQMMMTQRQ
jgi:hypothetical protein